MHSQDYIDHMRELGRRGGKTRAKAFTPKYQRDARANVSSQSCAINGAKGYAALVAAGKGDLASKIAADYRFANPTNLEVIVADWLDELVTGFDRKDRSQREVQIGKYYVDFLLRGRYVIEVNGAAWHVNGHFPVKGDVEGRDMTKREYLEAQGYEVTTLGESAILSGAARQTLVELAIIINDEQEF